MSVEKRNFRLIFDYVDINDNPLKNLSRDEKKQIRITLKNLGYDTVSISRRVSILVRDITTTDTNKIGRDIAHDINEMTQWIYGVDNNLVYVKYVNHN